MNEFARLRIRLECAVTGAQISICQGQRWDRLPTVGALDFGSKYRVLQTGINHEVREIKYFIKSEARS